MMMTTIIEHTHLVKGLDKALAEKVRREEQMTRRMQQSSSHHQSIGIDDTTTLDLDEMLEDAYNNNTTQKKKEPKELVTSDWRSTKQTRTELGTSMLNYLLQKEQKSIYSSTLSSASSSAAVMNPSAVPIQHSNISSSSSSTTLMVQRSIQQTIYNFALMSNVHQRHGAWEVPQIRILSTTSQMTSGSRRDNMSPLSKDIIMAIKKKLDSRASSSSSLTNSNEKSNNYPSSASHVDAKTKLKTTKKKNSEEETEDPSRESYNDDNIYRNGENTDNDDSDDDSDIFDNVGTYTPTQQEETD
jgi:hypothetical protein